MWTTSRPLLGPDPTELLREFVEYVMAHALSRIDGLVRIERMRANRAAKEAKRLEKLLGKKAASMVKPDEVKKPRSQKKAGNESACSAWERNQRVLRQLTVS